MKRYKLLKELPGRKVGDILIQSRSDYDVYEWEDGTLGDYGKGFIELHTDWFEEIKEEDIFDKIIRDIEEVVKIEYYGGIKSGIKKVLQKYFKDCKQDFINFITINRTSITPKGLEKELEDYIIIKK